MESDRTGEELIPTFLEEAKKKKRRGPEPLLPVPEVHRRVPYGALHGYPAQQLIRMIQMGMKEAVLGSRAIWLCVSCETCGTRCPNEIDIGVLMDALREMAIEEGVPAGEKNIHLLHEAFVQSIKRGGRVHEATMLIDYKLRSRDFFTDLIPGMKLFLKGKIPLFPSLIKGRGRSRGFLRDARRKR